MDSSVSTLSPLTADHSPRHSEDLRDVVRSRALTLGQYSTDLSLIPHLELETVVVHHRALGHDGAVTQEDRHAAVIHGHGGE